MCGRKAVASSLEADENISVPDQGFVQDVPYVPHKLMF
jgi:hypothetical protein